MAKKTIRDIDVDGKRVLVRVDFNVPIERKSGKITDDRRIRAALPTITYLAERGARVILTSHLGRPGGQVRDDLRLEPVAQLLGGLLGTPVGYVRDSVGPEVEAAVANLKKGEVLLLENLRFHPEEERNDDAFARKLAALADIYVNDAFGAAHRAHASTEGVARHLPAVAGLLMEAELHALTTYLENPARPFAAIIGGAKISTKIGVLEQLIRRADTILIGGGMACTMLKAQGVEVGDSLVEDDKLDLAATLMQTAREKGATIVLPVDAVIAASLDADDRQVVDIKSTPLHLKMYDIGPRTIDLFKKSLASARTILWNGPMGVFEVDAFAKGTIDLARAIARLDAITVVGGGETAAAVEIAGVADRMTHVSTGGGATLELLEGKTLPGVAALDDRENAR